MSVQEFERNYKKVLPSSKSAAILDLGCGDGAFLSWLKKKGYEDLTGVDLKPASIDGVVFHRDEIIRFLQSNRKRYDLIMLRFVIEHFKKEDLNTLVELLDLRLVSGGRLVIETPNAGFILAASQRWADLEHEVMFTPETLSKLLSTHFKIKRRGYSCPAGIRARTTLLLFWFPLRFFLWLLAIGNWRFLVPPLSIGPEDAAFIVECVRK